MQQINLYLPEFQPNREPFRSSHILGLLLVSIVLLCAVTLKTHQNNNEIAKTIEQDKLQTQNLRAQLQEFASYKNPINMVDLDNKIFKLKNEIARRQQLLQLVSYQDLGNDTGFSGQLESMARQSNPGIALEIFSIKHGGRYLELVGKTTSADKLPAYIHALQSEKDFKEVSFGVLKIEPVSGNTGHLQFVLAEAEKEITESVSAVQLYIKEKGRNTGNRP